MSMECVLYLSPSFASAREQPNGAPGRLPAKFALDEQRRFFFLAKLAQIITFCLDVDPTGFADLLETTTELAERWSSTRRHRCAKTPSSHSRRACRITEATARLSHLLLLDIT